MNLRVYPHGPPNSDKTGAIVRTAPRPLLFINAPGETGDASIPRNDPSITVYPPFDPTQPSKTILAQVEQACIESIASGNWREGTIAFEGIHNLMDYVMDAQTDGGWFEGELTDKKDFGLYPRVYRWMDHFVSRLMVNNVHLVIVTGWSKEKGERKTKPGEQFYEVPQTTGPALLGEYSRMIVGRIPLVFHQKLRLLPDTLDAEGKHVYASAWQTRPYGAIKGVGIKGPRSVVEAMPLYIPADYRYLKQIWEEHE
jgi:hypothetical protein